MVCFQRKMTVTEKGLISFAGREAGERGEPIKDSETDAAEQGPETACARPTALLVDATGTPLRNEPACPDAETRQSFAVSRVRQTTAALAGDGSIPALRWDTESSNWSTHRNGPW